MEFDAEMDDAIDSPAESMVLRADAVREGGDLAGVKPVPKNLPELSTVLDPDRPELG